MRLFYCLLETELSTDITWLPQQKIIARYELCVSFGLCIRTTIIINSAPHLVKSTKEDVWKKDHTKDHTSLEVVWRCELKPNTECIPVAAGMNGGVAKARLVMQQIT